tara:strand:- start:3781 stop:4062 length:282 start_codon:yes stop_codon:yes gene_type:complete
MSIEESKIMRAIGNLEGTVKKGFEDVDKGFQGSHKRQDTANGRTEKVEDKIKLISEENTKQETDLKWLKRSYWVLIGIGVPAVISILVKLFTL